MDIVLLNTADQPIYQQIKNQMIAQILDGRLQDGEKLPSIRGLAKALKVSVITTKRAYEDLEADGFIDTVPGRGSFVSSRDRGVLRDHRIGELRERLKQAVTEAKQYKVSEEEIIRWMKQWYREE